MRGCFSPGAARGFFGPRRAGSVLGSTAGVGWVREAGAGRQRAAGAAALGEPVGGEMGNRKQGIRGLPARPGTSQRSPGSRQEAWGSGKQAHSMRRATGSSRRVAASYESA